MYYPDDIVEEIRTRSDIVDVIGSYVHLQKKGSNHFGLCPFHNEKSPSFSVSGTKQMYHCFGCGEGGNVITFVMKYENMSFGEALKLLANRAGVKLPEIEYSEEARKKDDLKARILEVNKEAARFYYYALRSEAGRVGHDYLTGRGLSEETLNKFGLGFAVPGKDVLYRHLSSRGFSDSLLRDSGIFNFKESSGMMDKFWNRVIFPIMDVNHRVIGFGGRVMGQGEPKYLNSPETPVFDKGRNLYGLNHARTSRKKNLLICEGYMDVIALHQAGFDQAVASLGTALTSGQASLMRRYTDEVLISYDSDEAGVKAALRAIPILKESGLTAKVIDMRPYKDPDEFIKNLGSDEFSTRIENAENSFYYEIRMLERDFDLADPESKTKFCNEIAKRILVFEDDLERDNYIQAVCQKYRLKEVNLTKLVAKNAMKGENIRLKEKPKSGINSKKKDPGEGNRKAQRLLLTWLYEEPGIYDSIRDYISADDFTEGTYKKAAEMFFDQLKEGKLMPAAIISRFTDEEEQSRVAALFNTSLDKDLDTSDKEKAIKELVIKIRSYGIELKSKENDGGLNAITQMIESRKQLEALNDIQIRFRED